jgi:hypothetical protein
MSAWKRVLSSLAIAFVLASPILADSRRANIDVVIALDKSLSMENKIGAVKSWVNTFIMDQLIIPGDFLSITSFYGKAEVIISQVIKDEHDKLAVKALISQIKGNGRFTDIGNALDVVKAQLADKEKDGREKYVLLLTDGIQEAPPASKYYSKNGMFNHEFLANTKTIQQKGWKVMILGIGIDTAAKDLAKALRGSYSEISSAPTPATITETAGILFGTPTIDGAVNVSPIGVNGSSRISFVVKPSGLAGDMRITVNDLNAQFAARTISGLLSAPLALVVKKDGMTRVSFPVRFPPDLKAGTYSGTLEFVFGSTERLSPAQVPVSFQVMGWIQSNILLLAAALVLLLILAALIAFVIWRATRGKPLQFVILIDDKPVKEEVISLRAGRELFLNDISSTYSLAAKRTGKSVARFLIKDRMLSLEILKQDRFPKLKEVPPEVRGKTFILRSESGKNQSMKVQSREKARSRERKK